MPTTRLIKGSAATAAFGMLAVLSPAQAGKTTQAQATEESLLRAEDALFAADVSHDIPAIERGFADEAIFVHANGTVQTKADYLAATRDAKFPIKSIDASDRVVRIFGDVGVVRGTKTLLVGDMHLSGSYLTVYVMRGGRWQMLDEQSAPAPRPPEAR
jgi:ketosteroid isomerase-like protein